MEQHISRSGMQRQRKIGEESHVSLVARVCGRHRERITQQPVIVRLAKQIAPQQLPGVRCSLYPFHHARQHMSLIVRFVWTARMFEMRFGASIWENYKAKEQCDPKRNEHDPGWPAQRPDYAFGDDNAKQSVRDRTANKTRLVAEG